MEENIAYQVVTIRNGKREVIETTTLELALATQAALPFPTRLVALEVGFPVEQASHLH